MIIYEDQDEVIVRDVPLAHDLMAKWGYDPDQEKIAVNDISKITCELSAWGVPWKRALWSY